LAILVVVQLPSRQFSATWQQW